MAVDSRLALLRQNFTHGDCEAVHFCALTPQQSEMVRAWRNHPAIVKAMYNQENVSYAAHHGFIKSLRTHISRTHWAVFEQGQGIGTISLARVNFVHSNAFLGIYVAPEHFGTGRGAKILELLEFISFKQLKLHSLHLETFEHNTKAIAFYERNGFVHEGCLRGFACVNDTFYNIIVMGKINA